jgi:hypothetical protein
MKRDTSSSTAGRPVVDRDAGLPAGCAEPGWVQGAVRASGEGTAITTGAFAAQNPSTYILVRPSA